MTRPPQPLDALYANSGRTSAFDLRAHLVEQVGTVGHFGLAGTVLHDRLAFGEGGRHQQVFGSRNGDLVEDNLRAAQALGAGFYIAVLLGNGGTEPLQPLDMEIDGARADSTSARKRDAGPSPTCDSRTEYQRGGSHGLDQFVRSFRACEIPAGDSGAMLGTSIAQLDFCTHGSEEFARGLDVAHLGNILQDYRFFGQQRGSHGRQGGVLGAA